MTVCGHLDVCILSVRAPWHSYDSPNTPRFVDKKKSPTAVHVLTCCCVSFTCLGGNKHRLPGRHRIPLAGGLQTTGSGGCLTEYSGVLKRRTFPIYPKRCARGDLVAQRGRDGVELVPRVAPLPPFGGPSLRGLRVAGAFEGLAAVALAAGAMGGRPGQVVPHRRGLLVAEAVLAVRDPVHVQRLHVGASFEAPGARVLDGPPPGLEVVDDLERLEHQGVPDRQVAGPLLEGDAELGAAGGGPHHVEVPGLEGLVVPLQDVAADARAGLRVAVKTRYLPATGLEGTAPVPLNSSRSLIC